VNVKIARTNYQVHVKHDQETGLYVGIVPGFVGAHTQAATLDELKLNLEEVMELLIEKNNNQEQVNSKG
jgi:predicted RNase H-like HicB family nuclease